MCSHTAGMDFGEPTHIDIEKVDRELEAVEKEEEQRKKEFIERDEESRRQLIEAHLFVQPPKPPPPDAR